MLRHQRGITLIGGLLIAVIIAVMGFAVIRLLPVYLEYQKVVSALTQLESVYSAGGATEEDIRNTLQRRFDVEDVSSLAVRDITIRRAGGLLEVTAEYTAIAPFVANISFLVEFSRTVSVHTN
jgi:hypothetical protein